MRSRSSAGMSATLTPDVESRLRELVREIPDFPRAGISFKDITPLIADRDALADAVRGLAELARALRPQVVVAAEARGFLLGPALALALGAGFALARKPGKLPYSTISAAYELEYGSAELELHSDAVPPGARVLVHDDLLVEQLGAEVVGCGFLIELAFLGGRDRVAPREVHALLRYEA